MIKVKTTGSFKNTTQFLKRQYNIESLLHQYGKKGVSALKKSTPVDSGKTASSWRYEIKRTSGGYSLTWVNDNIVDGVPIAILLEYGHVTRTGGYVSGRHYVNPAINPIVDELSEKVWLEVVK